MTCNALRCPRSTEWKEKVFGIRLIHSSLGTKFIQHPCLCLFSQHLWHRESSSLVAELPVISFSTTTWHFPQWSFISLFVVVGWIWFQTAGMSQVASVELSTSPSSTLPPFPQHLRRLRQFIPDLYKPWFPQSETGQALSLKIVLYPHRLMETSLARQHDFICTSTGRW